MIAYILPPLPGYDELSPAARAAIVNGCGAQGWKIDFVPDEIKCVDISEVCNRHDYRYDVGQTEDDKINADYCFLTELLIVLHAALIAEPHKMREAVLEAVVFYESVSKFGDGPFWRNKQPPAPPAPPHSNVFTRLLQVLNHRG